MKICSTCREKKDNVFFSKNKNRKDGFSARCKICVKKHYVENKSLILKKQKEYRDKNAEIINKKLRDYYSANTEKYSKAGKIYYHKKKDDIKERVKKYRENEADKVKVQKRQYYLKNKDKINLKSRLYEQENKEAMNEKRKEYCIANLEKIRTYKAKWLAKDRKINPEKHKENARKYRKTERGKAVQFSDRHRRRTAHRNGDVSSVELSEIIKNAKVCYWCRESLKNKKIHIDHYIPLSKGGEHTLTNLVVSCSVCNQKKSAKDPIEFANSVGKLL